jgi:hypothetical protein
MPATIRPDPAVVQSGTGRAGTASAPAHRATACLPRRSVQAAVSGFGAVTMRTHEDSPSARISPGSTHGLNAALFVPIS